MIIESLLEQDVYKFNMQRIFVEKFFNCYGKYEFRCRTPGIKFTPDMYNDIMEELKHVSTLRFKPDEIDYIKNIKYHNDAYGYIAFLKMFKLDFDHLSFALTDGNLSIVAEGPIYQVSMWEIFILAIVQEVYWNWIFCTERANEVRGAHMNIGLERLENDIYTYMKPQPFMLTEFGTRRRFSKAYQEYVIELLIKEVPKGYLFGTSNVYFAKKYGLKAAGTMAHEYICLGQALKHVPVAESQTYMLDKWYELYGDSLGTALSDTLGTEKFLKDFTPRYAKLFDGVRHDSGDPIEWAEKMINHFQNMNIDANNKLLFFSDSLTLKKAAEINKYLTYTKMHAKNSFGIGTSLTNNIPDLEPLNNVFKLTEANGLPVAKLSDSPGKIMCNDEEYVKYLNYVINKR